jgi:hypothetical protein
MPMSTRIITEPNTLRENRALPSASKGFAVRFLSRRTAKGTRQNLHGKVPLPCALLGHARETIFVVRHDRRTANRNN